MFKRKIYLHLLFWFAYLFYQAYLEYLWMTTSESYSSMSVIDKFKITLSSELVNIILVKIPLIYTCYFLIDRIGYRRQKNLLLLFSLMGTLIFFLLFGRIIFCKFSAVYIYGEPPVNIFNLGGVLTFLLELTMLAGAFIGIKQYRKSVQLKQREKDLLQEKIALELKLLKAQINPHFLFNTLNNIYGLARKNPHETAPYILKLSKILRYVLYEAGEPKVSLSNEILVIEEYISIEKIRYSNRLTIAYKNEIQETNATISPLILFTFIENAFKHGPAKSVNSSYVNIEFKLTDHKFYALIENSKEADSEIDAESKKHIGLQNITRQLNIMYQDYTLEIKDEATKYSILLYINLNSYVPKLHYN